MGQPGMELPPSLQVMQMMMGHWVAQVLATVAELGVADHLAGGGKTSGELAGLVKADPDALHRLLRVASGIGLVEESAGQRYSLTALGDCLRTDSPSGLRDFIVAELAPGHWLPWGRLGAAVRTGAPQSNAALGMDIWAYYAKNRAEGETFARGMGNLSQMAAREVTAAVDFSSHPVIADIGGSQGVLIASVLHASPRSRGIVFDRPDVIAGGADKVKSYGLGDRLTSQAGDFFDAVPTADAYLLKAILHDWNDEDCVAILKTIARAAKPDGKLYVVEALLSDSPAAMPVKLLDLNMLVMLGGRERTVEQYAALFGASGWKLETTKQTAGLFAVMQVSRA